MRVEVLIGRSLAAMVHPIAAWRMFPLERRLLLLLAYWALGYIAVFLALLAL